MRYSLAIIFVLIGTIWTMPVQACSDDGSGIKVFLAVPKGRAWSSDNKRGGQRLYVIIQNNSPEAIKLYDAWNSWGYFNVSLAWHDSAGHSGTVKPEAVDWNKNFPSTTTLQSGEVLVQDVSTYGGWPNVHNTSLSVKAIYESKSDPHEDGWCGKAESKEVTLQFW